MQGVKMRGQGMVGHVLTDVSYRNAAQRTLGTAAKSTAAARSRPEARMRREDVLIILSMVSAAQQTLILVGMVTAMSSSADGLRLR
jgi:hypothetical protein